MENKHDDVPIHVLPESIEIGDFAAVGCRLQAEISLILGAWEGGKEYRRSEKLVLFVEPHGNEIAVEVYDPILDFLSLAVVAEYVAVKLNTEAGGALKMSSGALGPNRRRGAQVRVPFPGASAD